MEYILVGILAGLVGLAIGYGLRVMMGRNALGGAEQQADMLRKTAAVEVEATRKEAKVHAKSEVIKEMKKLFESVIDDGVRSKKFGNESQRSKPNFPGPCESCSRTGTPGPRIPLAAIASRFGVFNTG